MYTNRRRVARVITTSVACVLAAATLGAPVLTAQTHPPGRIEGRVFDSVHARPPSDVIVQAVRLAPAPATFKIVRADEEGRFHLDSLAAGRYWLSISNPFIDSLALPISEREIVVEEGGRARVELAIPSGATLRSLACPGLELDVAHGAVIGTVVDAGSDKPLSSATVVVAWTDLVVDKKSARWSMHPRTGAVLADSLGRYRLCGVPTNLPLRVQVQHAGGASSVVELLVHDSHGMLRQDLSFSATLAADSSSAPNTSPNVLSGTAVLTGTVLGAQARPLADVELRLAGANGTARTDSAGRFTLSDLPAGTHMLELRRVGYFKRRVPVELRSGRPISRQIQLSRVVSLDSIRIVAQRAKYSEFERRRGDRVLAGTFLDEEQIRKGTLGQMSDLFRSRPGFRIVDNVLLSSRDDKCGPNIVVDEVPFVSDINYVEPFDVAAIEIYPSTHGAPPEYNADCGLIIIWTKR